MIAKEKKMERWLFILVGLLILTFLAVIVFTLFKYSFATPYKLSDHPQSITYVDNKLCLQCHQPEAKSWLTSHHALAMAETNSTSVIGNFNKVSFTRDGVISQFFKRNNKFYVNTQGPTGKFADFETKYTFGIDPIQQYLIEFSDGRLQNFTIAWDVNHHKWFDLYPNEKTPPGDVLHWAGHYQNANMMCVSCHTTNFQKNYDEKNNTYASTWSEMNVSCQSCHGPGGDHIKWAKTSVEGKNSGENKGLLVDFKQGDAHAVIETCGICHSRRSELTTQSSAGKPLMDNYLPALLSDGLYYPDGQQQAEVYVYNSFRQSKMYQMGVSCVDCHNPHTGKLKYVGNAICTQCHSPEGDKRFPTAAKLYDDPSHTFHKKDSPGSQCVSCHMPAKNYMIIHPRPDHSIRIPRPDLSMKLNTPNACTNCHTDKTNKWANDWIIKWYGVKQQAKIHYGEVIAAGRSQQPGAEEALITLAGDTSEPNVVRATALDLLSLYGQASITVSIESLHHADPAIRRAAITSLEKLSHSERLSHVAPFLKDPIRAVRIEAARVLSSVPLDLFNTNQRTNFNSAFDELISSQKVSADMPGSNLNLGIVYENTGHIEQAEQYYKNALHIDPDFTPARLNLARFYNNIHRNDDAEQVLQEGIKRTPTQGELYYSLGLLLAEKNHLQDASNALAQAVKLLPTQTRIRYNYALTLQQLGERKKAEQELLTLTRLEPNNLNFIYAIAVFYSQDKMWDKALEWANKLEELNPGNSQIQQFVLQIKSNTA